MAPPNTSELMNLLRPESNKAGEDCTGGGNIYAQTLLHSTKKEIEKRKLNQDVFTSGISRNRMGEVELTNYGPRLVEMSQAYKRHREENKEAFTPDISRNLYESKADSNYAKYLVEQDGPIRADRLRQEAINVAHSGDIFRNVAYQAPKRPMYPVQKNGPKNVERLRQEANKGAHSGSIFRDIYDKDAKGPTPEYSNPRMQRMGKKQVTGVC